MPIDQKIVDVQIRALGDFHQWFARKEVRHLSKVMNEGETIQALTSGVYEGNTWLVAVTTHRMLFLDKRLFGLKQAELPLHQIIAVVHRIGFLSGKLLMATTVGQKDVTKIPKAETEKIANIVSVLVRGAQDPSSGSASKDIAAQLERLAALMERGLLTREEFTVQKAKLLS